MTQSVIGMVTYTKPAQQFKHSCAQECVGAKQRFNWQQGKAKDHKVEYKTK